MKDEKTKEILQQMLPYLDNAQMAQFSQILPRDYSFKEARTVMHEMTLNGAAELMKRKVITSKVGIFVGYTHDERAPTKGMAKLDVTTNLASFLIEASLRVFDKTTDHVTPIRRLGIVFEDVCDEGCEGYNLFTDWGAVERERSLQHTMLSINERFGKNAILSGINYMPEGTQRERNGFICRLAKRIRVEAVSVMITADYDEPPCIITDNDAFFPTLYELPSWCRRDKSHPDITYNWCEYLTYDNAAKNSRYPLWLAEKYGYENEDRTIEEETERRRQFRGW